MSMTEEELQARRELLETTDEPTINVNGVPVPLSMAGKAVARCIRAIQIVDELLPVGFAGEDDLKRIRAGLTGEDELIEGTKDAPVRI